MKKILCTFLCIAVGLGIAFPIVYMNHQTMNAAEALMYEKFDFFSAFSYLNAGGATDSAYGVTKNNEVYFFESIAENHLYGTSGFIKNEYGNLITDAIQVSGNGRIATEPYGIALRKDGTLYLWGDNSYGQFGNGSVDSTGTYSRQAIAIDPQIDNIVSVVSGVTANYVITANGDVYASGDNTHGQLGNGTQTSSSTFTKVNINNVKKIICVKSDTVYALKKDGTLYTWGRKTYDGVNLETDVPTPKPLYAENQIDLLNNVVDIDVPWLSKLYSDKPGVAIMTYDGANVKGYIVGLENLYLNIFDSSQNQNIGNVVDIGPMVNSSFYGAIGYGTSTVVLNNHFYSNTFYDSSAKKVLGQQPLTSIDYELPSSWASRKTVWFDMMGAVGYILFEDGTVECFSGNSDGSIISVEIRVPIPFLVSANKADGSSYASGEKHNGDVTLNAISSSGALTCQIEDPLGSTATACTDFINDSVSVNLQNDRIYRKYIISNGIGTSEFIVDLYQGKPILSGYSSSSPNQIKIMDNISLAVPSDQSDWNTYSATITDASGNTSNFTGGTLNAGNYTLTLTDAYGNTQDYQFQVTDKPTPSAVFTPSSTSLVYHDAYTRTNATIGTIALQYPAGEPTSYIASIQLGTGGDEALFSVDTSGALKVKGNDLNAGTYNISVSGKDGNQMDFSKAIQIVVGKANQDNYQITNNANYPLIANQTINITTSGNDSGENETYTITSGNGVARIVNSNQFKLLSAGTFTLEATVAGNANYNPKTVTKQITISQLPTQNPAIKITSGDAMMYGDMYIPTYSGGSGSGAVSWTIENDNGTGAVLNNGSIQVNSVGTFTLKVTKAGDATVQSSSDSKVITVNKRRITVTPKSVTKYVGQAFKDNGVTYNPQPLSGDTIGTPIITSKYPISQAAGHYSDGIQVSGLSHPNYDFVYQEGTLIINSNTLPNNGRGYYTVTGTKGKNNWYISDIQITPTGKDGYDQISDDGINFQTQLTYQNDGDYAVTFYLKNSSTGIVSSAIRYQAKIDQTAPSVPTLTMRSINTSTIASLINALSFGNWMKESAEVTMASSDATSGIDYYEYTESDQSGSKTKTSTSGIVNYYNDAELTIKAKACDKAGNCSNESNDEALMIDRLAPVISGVKDQSVYKYYYLPRYVNVKDNGSGLAYAQYTKDGVMMGTIREAVDERIDGVGTYAIKAIDNAGNEGNLSFKIVPLPSIDDIDGSDESKDIIEQVEKELDEIKGKIDDTEKAEYEKWIEDAWDKWNSQRKTELTDEDTGSKVKGEGDTTFDPKTELVVQKIDENTLPQLPRKAIEAYDVKLMKNHIIIQPDGSIKVYLPYTENEAPILYQIDENGRVSVIAGQREGNYVTFVSSKLLQYAISNEKQEVQNNDTCVVGPDGATGSGDEVCGKPNDKGDQPQKQPDGSVEVPEGGKVEFPNGSEIDTPDGATILPDGTVVLPDGTEYDPDGNKKEDKTCKLEGKDINVDTDGDGLPDLNLDLDGDCIADLNIDTNFDNIPDIDIDTKGDGKADINVDTNNDGKADLNIAMVKRWVPEKDCKVQDFAYDTAEGFTPYLNVDDDGDGNPDRNIDDNGDGIPDRNIDPDWFDKYGNLSNKANANVGGAMTGDNTKWVIWWILFILSGGTLTYSQYKKRSQA